MENTSKKAESTLFSCNISKVNDFKQTNFSDPLVSVDPRFLQISRCENSGFQDSCDEDHFQKSIKPIFKIIKGCPYSRVCRVCGKVFSSRQNRRKHERNACKIEPRNIIFKNCADKTTFNYEIGEPALFIVPKKVFRIENAERNEAPSINIVAVNDNTVNQDIHQALKITEKNNNPNAENRINRKKVAFCRLASYNKVISRRFNNFDFKKLSFLSILLKRYETVFYSTTKLDYLNKISGFKWKGEDRDKNMKMIDLTLDNNDSSNINILQYRTKCFVKCSHFIKDGCDLILYNSDSRNLLPVFNNDAKYFLYLNGAYISRYKDQKFPKICANDKTSWIIFDEDKNVIKCSYQFGASKFELGLIYKEYELLASLLKNVHISLHTDFSYDIPKYYNDSINTNSFMAGDTKIIFPYNPYTSQISFINTIVNVVDKKQTAVIESPTGSGKTLALLCSLLSWKNTNSERRNMQIFYFSRTHDQLKHVASEIKRTNFTPITAILGSRQKLCPIENIKKCGLDASDECEKARAQKSCSYFLAEIPWIKTHIVDIEDENPFYCTKVCPYYGIRKIAQNSEINLLPYSYLVDPYIRRSLDNLKWKNSIIIFDEAHNFTTTAEGACSFIISVNKLKIIIQNLTSPITKSLMRLAEYISGITEKDEEFPIEIINTIKLIITEKIKDFDEYLEFYKDELKIPDKHNKFSSQRTWCFIVFKLFYIYPHILKSPNSFKIFFSRTSADTTLEIKCYDPHICIEDILRLGAHSIIFTSGSLSPIDTFENELNYQFNVRLLNQHIIPKENSLFCIFSRNFQPKSFNFSFPKRTEDQFLQLAKTIYEISIDIPNGVIVYFQSYSVLSKFIFYSSKLNSWKSYKKQVFLETHTGFTSYDFNLQKETNSSINDFKENSIKENGALLLSVYRGKTSEGTDFPDNMCRSVILVGIPFTPPDSFRKNYYESIKKSYENWYIRNAVISVNQSIGRCFRHSNDYGSVILIDERYFQPNIFNLLPQWLNSAVEIKSITECKNELKKFYSKMEEKCKNIVKKFGDSKIIISEKKLHNPLPEKKLADFNDWSSNYLRFLRVRRSKTQKILIKEEPNDV